MELEKAKKITELVKAKLAPHCEKCEIAGSIRREKENVKDIEVVCIPKLSRPGKRSNGWCMEVYNLGQIMKGTKTKSLNDAKYIQINLPQGIKLDLFVAEPGNWGMQFMIRTGCAEFSKSMLTQFNKRGFKSENAYPIDQATNEKLEFETEEEVFEFLGLEYVEPKDRVEFLQIV